MRYATWIVPFTLIAVIAAVLTWTGRPAEHRYESNVGHLSRQPPLVPVPRQDIVFTNISLVAMTDDSVRHGQAVIVRNGRIHNVGAMSDSEFAGDLRVVDGEGAYLMPGLADMHVHLHGMPSELLLLLANGITTARIMAGKPQLLAQRDGIADGNIAGPQLYVAGPIIRKNMREGLAASTSVIPGTAEEAALEIERQNALGYDLVKPYTFLDRDIYRAVADSAGKLGLPLVGHIPFSIGLDGVIESGQQEIAHIHEFNKYFFESYDQTQFFTTAWPLVESRIPAIVRTVKGGGLMITTSLWVNQMLMEANEDFAAYLDRPMMQYELQSAVSYMTSRSWQFETWDPVYLRSTYIPWLHRFTRALSEGGVRLVLGTDSGYPGLVHGYAVHEELQLLVVAGLNSYEALQTATRNAAIAAGEDSWGTVRNGKRADLLLVRDNPLQDISNVREILGVMTDGRWYDRMKLDELLQYVADTRQ